MSRWACAAQCEAWEVLSRQERNLGQWQQPHSASTGSARRLEWYTMPWKNFGTRCRSGLSRGMMRKALAAWWASLCGISPLSCLVRRHETLDGRKNVHGGGWQQRHDLRWPGCLYASLCVAWPRNPPPLYRSDTFCPSPGCIDHGNSDDPSWVKALLWLPEQGRSHTCTLPPVCGAVPCLVGPGAPRTRCVA